jgi:uncharacterized protein (PEP-CTERM system associated)
VQRQQEVQRIMNTLGLPATLTAPLSFYTQQVYVSEQVQASVGLLGARNVVTFTVFAGNSEQVPATSNVTIQDAFATTSKINQRGAAANWSHRLTPLSTLSFLASWVQSEAAAPSTSESTTTLFSLNLNRTLSPKTFGGLGLRYTIFDSNVSNDYRETAVFGTINHTF